MHQHRDAGDIVGPETVIPAERNGAVDDRVGVVAGREGFDGGFQQLPAFSQPARKP